MATINQKWLRFLLPKSTVNKIKHQCEAVPMDALPFAKKTANLTLHTYVGPN
jgi:hypothetical protein